MRKALASSAASKTYPYSTASESAAGALIPALTAQCGSRLVRGSVDGLMVLDGAQKSVVVIDMPALTQEGARRTAAMDAAAGALFDELAHVAAVFPAHLVVYAGQPLPTLRTADSARQLANPPFGHAQQNTTLAHGGILKRYQLLTPALITSLLVVFFVFLPVLYVGISSLAAIQSPVKLDNFGMKTFDATQRKNQ